MYSTILQYLEKTAHDFPDKAAYTDRNTSLTFKDFLENAQKIGSGILKTVKRCNPVAVYMDKSASCIYTYLGAVYAGCFYVPIDPQMPVERVSLILETLNPGLIICDDTTKEASELFSDKYRIQHYKELLETTIDTDKLSLIRDKAKSTDILYVLFTSGSTGRPKGVTISHLAVIDFTDWICEKYKLTEDSSLCSQAPFYFDASVPDIFIPLKTGATLFIPEKKFFTFPKLILQYLKDKQINTLIWVPSALCNVVNTNAFNVCIPDSVKLVIFCGEVMPCKHLNVWKKHLPDARFVSMYGPTEATYACMYYDIDRDFSDDDSLPLGKACENSEIIILNENNNLASTGEIGEICILGQCLSSGYFGNQEKTQAAFVQNPVNKNWIELMYRTGDLAYVDKQNNVVFAGRKDFQIKRLGHRIELGEIESNIIAVDGVNNACCIYNHQNQNIIAVYSGSLSQNDLKTVLTKKIPQYMVPNKIIQLDKIPLNLNGKIDRKLIEEKYKDA